MHSFQNNALGATTFSGNAIVKLFMRQSFFAKCLEQILHFKEEEQCLTFYLDQPK